MKKTTNPKGKKKRGTVEQRRYGTHREQIARWSI